MQIVYLISYISVSKLSCDLSIFSLFFIWPVMLIRFIRSLYHNETINIKASKDLNFSFIFIFVIGFMDWIMVFSL